MFRICDKMVIVIQIKKSPKNHLSKVYENSQTHPNATDNPVTVESYKSERNRDESQAIKINRKSKDT